MTNAEVITRLKAYMNIVNGVEKERREFGKYCSRDKVAFAIAINHLEKVEKRHKIQEKALLFFLITIFAAILTGLGVKIAYMQRGYFALGGEIFIFPAVYFLFYGLESFFKSVKTALKECMEEVEDEVK